MKEMKVDAIKDGSVIDHLPPGKALEVIQILHLDPHTPVLLGTNLVSRKMGLKDIVKIVRHELGKDELDTLFLLAPEATLTIIRDYGIHQKRGVQLPDQVVNLFVCPNPHCVTNAEPAESRFHILPGPPQGLLSFNPPPNGGFRTSPPRQIRCHYCEKVYDVGKVIKAKGGF